MQFITQKLLTIFCENEFILLVVFGDISHYYGFTMQVLLNIFLSLQMALVPTSQVIYYSNHKAGIEPTFLRVFRLINNPTDNGDIDQLEIDKIKSLSKTLTKLVLFVKVNIKTFYTFCVGFNLVPIMLHGYSLAHSIILTLNGAITFAIAITNICQITGYQIIYLYILCKYYRIKLKSLNRRIAEKNFANSLIGTDQILSSYDALYREIDEYNSTYWSKILFSKWLIFGTAIVLLTSNSILSDIPIPLKVMIVYTALFLLFLFLVTIMSAASVNYTAFACYQPLNSLFASQINCRTKVSKQMNLRQKFKVFMAFVSTDCHY